MDTEMPGIGGIEATRRITAAHPNVALVMLTVYGKDEFVFAALRTGARGYLRNGARQEDVIRIIGGIPRATPCSDPTPPLACCGPSPTQARRPVPFRSSPTGNAKSSA
jgi:ActR/RegA family two-component response regulator